MDTPSRRNTTGRSLSALRVLMQTRPNALTQRGGDTVVMERVADGLRLLGHHVDIDITGAFEPRDYDLVHLYNFCTPDITETYARKCVAQNVPYVVTTMYEDWPLFFNPMAATYMMLERYVQAGQPAHLWDRLIEAIKDVPPSEIQKNEFTAAHAEALIPTGEAERDAILRHYPNTKRVNIYHCGCEVGSFRDNGDLFRKNFGLSDFVLCVGRLEWRKNQLMLMKALEDSDLPVVFLDGGFTYQPQYEAVMKAFKRKGKTSFIGRVTPEELASAFAASRLHVLPSWYELPGLVNIEAAHYGTNCVVTDYGTIRDYLGDDAFYCRPDDAASIRRAVEQAYYAPKTTRLQEKVKQFTWANSTKQVLGIYEEVLQGLGYISNSTTVTSMSANDPQLTRATLEGALPHVQSAGDALESLSRRVATGGASLDDLVSRADEAAFSMKQDEARKLYGEVLAIDPQSLRALRGMGVISLTEKNYGAAQSAFEKCLAAHPKDVATLTGMGSALWNQGDKENAVDYYIQALEIKPDHRSALAYLTGACYDLDRLDVLELALSKALEIDSSNEDMQFCFAGCLYKQGKIFMARMVVDQILARTPNHSSALELRAALDGIGKTTHQAASQPTVEIVPPANAREQASAGSAQRSRFEREVSELEELHRKKEYTDVIGRAEKNASDASYSSDQQVLFKLIRGEALACLNRIDEAQALFNEVESNTTYRYRILCNLGVVAAAREDWNTAEQLFSSALNIRPNYDVALAGLGLCHGRRGDLAAAWQSYSDALEQNPENMRALLGLLQVGYPLQKLSEVESALHRYLEFHPGNLSILYAHAGCCYAQGKNNEAVLQLEKIKIFEPGHQLANELLDKIQKDYWEGSRSRLEQ